jgi:hypothetical protein
MIREQANLLANITQHKDAAKLAQKAVECSTASLKAHSEGDSVGASMLASSAAGHLKDAAKLHITTLDDFAPPMVLDLAHLGKAQELHQSYVDATNEGKKNGR